MIRWRVGTWIMASVGLAYAVVRSTVIAHRVWRSLLDQVSTEDAYADSLDLVAFLTTAANDDQYVASVVTHQAQEILNGKPLDRLNLAAQRILVTLLGVIVKETGKPPWYWLQQVGQVVVMAREAERFERERCMSQHPSQGEKAIENLWRGSS